MKPHKPDEFEERVLAFLERRKGQVIDDDLLSKFAAHLWKKKGEAYLHIMRSMVKERYVSPHL